MSSSRKKITKQSNREELEQKIKELKKTNQEIRQRVQELKRFQRLGVGRELRMIELKKEVERLKKEQNN